jgi:aminopeptidase N
MAVGSLGEKRAIEALERAASREVETRVARHMRLAAQALRTGDKTDDQLKQLREDLDEMREENRRLKEQVDALKARIK